LNRPLTKRKRRRLPPEAYQELWKEVLRRDGWRCQLCGRVKDLQVHHIEARSHLGDDSEENLITLCADCHRRTHEKRHGDVLDGFEATAKHKEGNARCGGERFSSK
jgi:5-methylcytosine-specific restriction endonuclease McrA